MLPVELHVQMNAYSNMTFWYQNKKKQEAKEVKTMQAVKGPLKQAEKKAKKQEITQV